MTEDEFSKWLMKFDKNGDGLISKEELKTVIKRFGGRWFPGWRSRRAIKKADKDADGYISENDVQYMVKFAQKNLGINIVPN